MNYPKFAICIKSENCEDLTRLKIYQILSDESALPENHIRIIDDSGEDYLYPENYFITVDLPAKVETELLSIL